ncbi:MAG: alpha/beta hydrolase [Pseudomonadota bacterium]
MRRRTFLAAAGAASLASCSSPRTVTIPDVVAANAYPPLGDLIEINGRTVHATDSGSGGPPVVLLHGSNVNLRDWTFSIAGDLAKKRRVVAMDRPGYGHSERGPGTWTPARQASQLRAAARVLDIERPILVGHSWGAVVAFAWALENPQEVSGVVSVSGANMPWGTAADVLDGLGIMRAGARYYARRLVRNADNGGVEDFVARAFRPQIPPDGYLDYVGAPLSLRHSTMHANGQDLAQTHAAISRLSKRYPALDLPIEIVHGERDWLLTVDRHVIGFKEQVSQAKISVAPGVGHMAHHARPDLVETAVARISAAVS